MRASTDKKVVIIISSILILMILAAIFVSQLLGSPPDGDPSDSRPKVIVPFMSPPQFDGAVSDDWSSACKIDIVFTIPTKENLTKFDNISATIYMGHDDEYLFVASVIHSPGLNPYTREGTEWVPDIVRLLFDCNNDGILSFPEDGKQWYYMLGHDQRGWHPVDGFNGDLYYGSTISEHGIHNGWSDLQTNWTYDDSYDKDYQNTEGTIFVPPEGAYWSGSNDEGDEIVEIAIPLFSDDPVDGFNLERGAINKVGLCIEFVRQWGYPNEDLFDAWPGDGFTPETFENASAYAEMVIDLT